MTLWEGLSHNRGTVLTTTSDVILHFFSYYSELECVFEGQPLFKMAVETSGNHGVSRVMNSL